MTWPVYPIPAGVVIGQTATPVARWHVLDMDRPQTCLIVAEFGPAPVIDPRPRLGTPASTDLTARAVRICNRDPKAVQRYLATHAALTCSGVRDA